MKHINLSNWNGSITDWTKLNYLSGGLPDYYADIANIKGNVLRHSNNISPFPDYDTYTAGFSEAFDCNLEAGKTYTFKVFLESGTMPTCNFSFLVNNAWVNDVVVCNTANTLTKTYTINFTATKFRFWSNAGTSSKFKIMIVEGSIIPTAYEPTGSLVIEKNYYKDILEDLTWTLRNTGTNHKGWSSYLSYNYISPGGSSADWTANPKYQGATSGLDITTNGADSLEIGVYHWSQEGTTNIFYCITDVSVTEPEGWVIYPLATPEIVVVKQVKVSDLTITVFNVGRKIWALGDIADLNPPIDITTTPNLYLYGFTAVPQNETWVTGMISVRNVTPEVVYICDTTYNTETEWFNAHKNDVIYYW